MKQQSKSKSRRLPMVHLFHKFSFWFVASVLLVTASVQAHAQTKEIIIDDGVVSKIAIAPGQTITVKTNQTFADILIGNSDVIDVFPLTDNSLYIQTKKTGTTNVTLYSVDKKLLEVIDVRVRVDYSELERVISRAVPSAQIDVLNVNNRIRISGLVRDNVDKQRVLEIAKQFSSDPVVDAIKVKAAQQVELDVRILEVNRDSGRALGVELDATNSAGSGLATGTPGTTTNGAPFGTVVGQLLSISGRQVDVVINALESKNAVRRLANPKLVTTSGVQANFVAGGEVPIQTVDADGNIATEYREYGIRLNFLPYVLDDELIRLEVRPEVSDIDQTVTSGNSIAFSLTTRKAETTVSLRNGQSFAIAGLLSANNSRNARQVPWLGQVPILGALFSSRGFQKRETDLVILVTPRLVRPVGPDQPLKSPLDGARSTDDVELFLMGMLEVDRKMLRRFREGHGVVGPYGHMIDLEFEDGVIKKK
ncbi:type II and III secretion system protein family protein [Alisedimentitalea sp. MJ-SS2]|uniref:type II and III secretion system protein family protein n=1 Tax=Aliisedimentitalea sp. MJ-SS2 TaxID=3049795 RepID=UPI00290DAA5B|nr:type II and III secretion system protein family protein [Alisedimentitalea sp. MJ-SS2]MDU8928277.1 type II and III secretion system protein family protein [Alisedimentitalea sp. MJ-SS2]